MAPLLISIVLPVVALIFAAYFIYWLLKKDQGTDSMQKVSTAIRQGAGAFMKRQYKTIGIISLVLAIGLFLAYALTGQIVFGIQTALAFILGAISSAVSGIVGM